MDDDNEENSRPQMQKKVEKTADDADDNEFTPKSDENSKTATKSKETEQIKLKSPTATIKTAIEQTKAFKLKTTFSKTKTTKTVTTTTAVAATKATTSTSSTKSKIAKTETFATNIKRNAKTISSTSSATPSPSSSSSKTSTATILATTTTIVTTTTTENANEAATTFAASQTKTESVTEADAKTTIAPATAQVPLPATALTSIKISAPVPTNENVVETKTETEIETAKATATETNTDVDIDLKRREYFLAEAEYAPKHLIRYSAQEKLVKLISAYSEQGTTSSTFTEEPSCSRILTTQHFHTEIQTQCCEPFAMKMLTSSPKTLGPVGVKDQNEKSQFSTMDTVFEALHNKQHLNHADAAVTEADNLPSTSVKQVGFRDPLEIIEIEPRPAPSVPSINSIVCRICHNSENPERLVSPCLCKGSLSFVHIHCLERWISTSRSTICELCQFQYNTEQTLRYTCIQSLRMWYSRSMSRRALQEDCQMFSLLTLVAFGIIGTLLVGIQYYFVQGRNWGLSSMWTKGWLLFFLFTTLIVYFINIYMIVRSQLAPWYRWWQSARDIKLILENRKPFKILQGRRTTRNSRDQISSVQQQAQQQAQQQQQQQHQMTIRTENLTISELMAPTLPVLTTSAYNNAASTSSAVTTTILSLQNKVATAINMSQDAIAYGKVCGVPAAADTTADAFGDGVDTGASSTATATDTAICIATTTAEIKNSPSSCAVTSVASDTARSLNKLQISLKLTATAAEIIEIPLEDFDDSKCDCELENQTSFV